MKFLLQCLAVSRDTSSGLVQAHDTSAGADPPDGAQSEDGLAREGLQVEEDAEDPVKAQELRLEGNEHFKARHPSFIRHEAVSWAYRNVNQALWLHEAGRIYEAREAYSEALHLSPQAGEEGDEPSKEREGPERIPIHPSVHAFKRFSSFTGACGVALQPSCLLATPRPLG